METIQEESQESNMEISMHALTGNTIHHTIRIQRMTEKKAFTILIDSGTTLNFLDTELLIRLTIHHITLHH